MVRADASEGHAVLPAFILGPVMSRDYQQHRQEQQRLRVVAFAFVTRRSSFLKGSLNVSLGAVFANLGLLAALFAAKMVPKLGLVYPLARRADRPHAAFVTRLMSTGLRFGTISSLYTVALRLFDGGRKVVQVQRWLGHHSPSLTLDCYVHLLEDDLGRPLAQRVEPRRAPSGLRPHAVAVPSSGRVRFGHGEDQAEQEALQPDARRGGAQEDRPPALGAPGARVRRQEGTEAAA